LPTILADGIAAVLKKILAALVVLLISSYFVSMGLGLFLIYAMPQGLDAASRQVAELPFSVLMNVNFRIPLGVSVGFFFLVIWLLYSGAFILAWFDRPSFPSSLRSLSRPDVWRSNYLVALPQFASVLFVAVVFLQALQESAGVQTGGISFESPVLGFLSISYAPLVEEFSYRITTIGILDGLNHIWKMRRLPSNQGRISAIRLLMLNIWKPERAKEVLGYNTIRNDGVRRGISRFEWIVLVLTSGAFGAVHYLSGGGWEIGKISTAMLSGFAMGFVYLRYGVYAPILLHWFFNYYFGTFDLASQLNMAGSDSASFAVELLNLGTGALLVVATVAIYLLGTWSSKHHKTQM